MALTVEPLPKIDGDPLPIASISAAVNAALVGAMTDHDIITRWHAGREQRPGDSMTVDLGQPRTVHGAETLIAGYVADFPRQLSIETSLDGQVWSPAWSGGTAIMALSGRSRGSAQRPAAVSIRAALRALPPVHADGIGANVLLVCGGAAGTREIAETDEITPIVCFSPQS